MAKSPGALWVDGATLHFIDKTGNEWYFTGSVISTPAGANLGAVYVDASSTSIQYIDTSGVLRRVANVLVANRPSATAGALFVETSANTNYSLHIVDGGLNERACHSDTG